MQVVQNACLPVTRSPYCECLTHEDAFVPTKEPGLLQSCQLNSMLNSDFIGFPPNGLFLLQDPTVPLIALSPEATRL